VNQMGKNARSRMILTMGSNNFQLDIQKEMISFPNDRIDHQTTQIF